jgi:hypothetical protein
VPVQPATKQHRLRFVRASLAASKIRRVASAGAVLAQTPLIRWPADNRLSLGEARFAFSQARKQAPRACRFVAVLAREHGIPFYVAAPLSTIDLRTPDGGHIPIEERSAREVTHVGSSQVAPAGAKIWNPGFDVTPHHLIAGIITEKGIFRAPYSETLRGAFEQVGIAELQESQK